MGLTKIISFIRTKIEYVNYVYINVNITSSATALEVAARTELARVVQGRTIGEEETGRNKRIEGQPRTVLCR